MAWLAHGIGMAAGKQLRRRRLMRVMVASKWREKQWQPAKRKAESVA